MLLVLIPTIVIVFIAYSTSVQNNSVEIDYEKAISGTVNKLFVSRGNCHVKIDSNNFFITIDHSRNYDYEKYALNEFLSKGDTVVKNQCSDTLQVIKSGTKFVFLIGSTTFNNDSKSNAIKKSWDKQRRIILNKGKCK